MSQFTVDQQAVLDWMPNPERCPAVIMESLARYVERRVPTGDFLRAVLENNLKEAVGRADWINGPAIHHIVSYCYNELPAASWGSPEKVREWLGEVQP